MCVILYNGDCIVVMQKIKTESVDVIFADPPYFLSNGGKTISSGKIVSVNKGEWDKKENYDDTNKFTYNWISECYRILKKNVVYGLVVLIIIYSILRKCLMI